MPTQLLWGMRDPFLGPALSEGLERWVPSIVVRPLAQAGHWAQWSAAAEVNAALTDFVDFLRGPGVNSLRQYCFKSPNA